MPGRRDNVASRRCCRHAFTQHQLNHANWAIQHKDDFPAPARERGTSLVGTYRRVRQGIVISESPATDHRPALLIGQDGWCSPSWGYDADQIARLVADGVLHDAPRH